MRHISYNISEAPRAVGNPNVRHQNRNFDEIDSAMPSYGSDTRVRDLRWVANVYKSNVESPPPISGFAENLPTWAIKLSGNPVLCVTQTNILVKYGP